MPIDLVIEDRDTGAGPTLSKTLSNSDFHAEHSTSHDQVRISINQPINQ